MLTAILGQRWVGRNKGKFYSKRNTYNRDLKDTALPMGRGQEARQRPHFQVQFRQLYTNDQVVNNLYAIKDVSLAVAWGFSWYEQIISTKDYLCKSKYLFLKLLKNLSGQLYTSK